jgi:integrase
MTVKWLKGLRPPAEGRDEYYDLLVPGLALRVSATGTMSWVVKFRRPGETVHRRATIGRCPPVGLSEARERARAELSKLDRGSDLLEARQEAREAPTFAEVAKQYIELYAEREKRSWADDAKMLAKDLLPAWGHRKAADIRRRDVVELLDAIHARGAPIRANRTLALARKIFNWGIGRDLVEMNPCLQVARVAPEVQRDRVLSEAELRDVWSASSRLRLAGMAQVRLRLLTAQRGGEILSMAWADLDLSAGWWTIPAAMAKNGLSHRVPLSGPAVAILQSLPRRSAWVFPGRETGHQVDARVTIARVVTLSGVDFRGHDLRRTAASHMTGMGIPRLTVSKILNHVETGVTRVYDRHSYDQEKRAALDLWAERLMAMVG